MPDIVTDDLSFIICHRGASAYAPQNTYAAFDCAHKMGGRWVEFDVRLCGSGEIVVFHDHHLKAFSMHWGSIKRLSYERLSTVNVAGEFTQQLGEQYPPLLQEVLPYLARRGFHVNIELKPDLFNARRLVQGVLKNVREYWPSQIVAPLYSCFSGRTLKYLHRIDAAASLAILMSKWSPRKVRLAQKLNCFSVNMASRLVTKQRVDKLHAMGFKVMVFTVNSKQRALELKDLGVDSIFTDYPDLLTKD